MRKFLLALTTALTVASVPAGASPIDTSPITDAYVVHQGELDWAWVSPVSSLSWPGNTLYAPETQTGWRYATASEFDARPTLQQFQTVLCASRFWNSSFTHCDYGDIQTYHLTGTSNDLLYVRDVAGEVPEPAALGLLGLGVLGIATRRRRA